MPDMNKLVVGANEFTIVDQDAQDHLLEHDQKIEQILDNTIINKNMLINSDFICNTFDDTDLNKTGWSFLATSETKPQLVNSMGLMILPPCIGVEILTPYWYPTWSITQSVPSIDFPITVSVEYAYNNLNPDTLKVASVTYSNTSRTSELVNIAELEEGKYLQVKLTNTGDNYASRSLFTLSDQLTKPLYIRRIKIERSEMATGFDQSMNDLSLLKEAKKMIADAIDTELDSTSDNAIANSAVVAALANKLDDSVHKTTNNGTFAGLVQTNRVWLIGVTRMSTTDSLLVMIHNYDGTLKITELAKVGTWSVNVNNIGTVSITWGSPASGTNVWGGAYRLF